MSQCPLAADQFLESGLAADRIEVGVDSVYERETDWDGPSISALFEIEALL